MIHWLSSWWLDPNKYNFSSSLWGELPLKVGIVVLFFKGLNCHVTGCWRPGHRVVGTPFRACRKHHPVLPHREPTSVEDIHAAHRDAVNRG